jgi:hypothetical protein
MAAKVGVDGPAHRLDITATRNFTGRDDLPRIVQPGRRLVMDTSDVLALHVTDRHRTHRRLPGLLDRGLGGMPGDHLSRPRIPIVDGADRDLADLQQVLHITTNPDRGLLAPRSDPTRPAASPDDPVRSPPPRRVRKQGP